jgi:hypothetical protein
VRLEYGARLDPCRVTRWLLAFGAHRGLCPTLRDDPESPPTHDTKLPALDRRTLHTRWVTSAGAGTITGAPLIVPERRHGVRQSFGRIADRVRRNAGPRARTVGPRIERHDTARSTSFGRIRRRTRYGRPRRWSVTFGGVSERTSGLTHDGRLARLGASCERVRCLHAGEVQPAEHLHVRRPIARDSTRRPRCEPSLLN